MHLGESGSLVGGSFRLVSRLQHLKRTNTLVKLSARVPPDSGHVHWLGRGRKAKKCPSDSRPPTAGRCQMEGSSLTAVPVFRWLVPNLPFLSYTKIPFFAVADRSLWQLWQVSTHSSCCGGVSRVFVSIVANYSLRILDSTTSTQLDPAHAINP